MNKIRSINSALPGLLSGIFLWGIICQLVGIFLVTDKVNYSIGLWIGVLTAVCMSIHMAYTLNIAVMKNVKGAQATATKNNIIRYLVVIIIFAILMVTEIGNPLVAFLGVMGLKISAYIQPVIHKITLRHKWEKHTTE